MRAILFAIIGLLAASAAQAEFRHAGPGGGGGGGGTVNCPYTAVTIAAGYPPQDFCSAADPAALVQFPDFFYGASGKGTPGRASQSVSGLSNTPNSYILGDIFAHIAGFTLIVDSGVTTNMAVGQSLCDGNGRCAGGTGSNIQPGTYLTGGSGSSWTVSISQTVASQEMWAVVRPTYNVAGVDYPIGPTTTTFNDPVTNIPTGCTYYDGSAAHPFNQPGTLWWQTGTTTLDGVGGYIGTTDTLQSGPGFAPSPVLYCAPTTHPIDISGLNLGYVGGHSCTEIVTDYATKYKFPVSVHNNRIALDSAACANLINGNRWPNSYPGMVTGAGSSGAIPWPLIIYNNEFTMSANTPGIGEFFGAPHNPGTCGGQPNCGNNGAPPQRVSAMFPISLSSNCSTTTNCVAGDTCVLPNCTAMHALTFAFNYVHDIATHVFGVTGVSTGVVATTTYFDYYANFFHGWSMRCAAGHGEIANDNNNNVAYVGNVFWKSPGQESCDTAVLSANQGTVNHGNYIMDSNVLAINTSGGNFPVGASPSASVTVQSTSDPNPGLVTVNSIVGGYRSGGWESVGGQCTVMRGGGYEDSGACRSTLLAPNSGNSGGSYLATPVTGSPVTVTAHLTSGLANYFYSSNNAGTFYGPIQITNNWGDLTGITFDAWSLGNGTCTVPVIIGGNYNLTTGAALNSIQTLRSTGCCPATGGGVCSIARRSTPFPATPPIPSIPRPSPPWRRRH
jgi:hypothetical protein